MQNFSFGGTAVLPPCPLQAYACSPVEINVGYGKKILKTVFCRKAVLDPSKRKINAGLLRPTNIDKFTCNKHFRYLCTNYYICNFDYSSTVYLLLFFIISTVQEI